MTAAPRDCDLVIRGAHVVTVDAAGATIPDGALAVDAARILALGPSARIESEYRGRDTIDAQGGVVHPGFIDAHIHVSQYTARSVLPRLDGTGLTMGHWKGELRPEDEYASALLAAVDYLKCGYTGFVDPGTIFAPDAVAAAAGEIGIRVWLTDPYVADRGHALAAHLSDLVSPSFLARWPKDTDEAARRIGGQLHRNRDPDGLVKAYIGLYGEGTDSEALMATALAAARSAGVRFQEHLGYLPSATRAREAALGRPLLAYLDERDLLGPEVTFIHMNAVRADEVALLAARGVRLVWCPYGQLQMIGRGAEARMTALDRAGVAIGIGSDIPRAVRFDGLGTLALAAAAAAGEPIAPAALWRLRTRGAAASVGAEREVGSLEPGKRADIVIRTPGCAESFGFDHGLELAALAGRDSVRMVLVQGRIVMQEGHVLRVDEAAVVARAHASAHAIAGRMGLIS
jgi:cytosine/adenosine deaminase-related metal-dependent hydrolase